MLRQVDEELHCAMGEEDPYIAQERPCGELLDYEEMVQLDGGIRLPFNKVRITSISELFC